MKKADPTNPTNATGDLTPDEAPTDRSVQIRMPRLVFVLVVLVFVIPWSVAGYLFALPRAKSWFRPPSQKLVHRSDPGGDSARMFMADPGPWGEIEFTRMDIEPPDEFVGAGPGRKTDVVWSFTGYSAARLEEFVRALGVRADEQATLLDRSRWTITEAGVSLKPGDDLIMKLEPAPRERLYAALARCSGNPPYERPFYFNPKFIDERFENCNLAPETIRMIRRMIYPRGKVLLFSDAQTAVNRTPDRDEQLRMLKTLARKTTLVGRLLVDPTSNLDGLVDYWARGGRAKDLEPLLSSLARVPNGCAIDIVHLIPPFARQRIYTYPFPSDDTHESREDCHWTALNFFNLRPDERLIEPQNVMAQIQEQYYPLPGQPQFGDLVFFIKPSSEVAHSCVYIADDVVFTKNGSTPDQPWLLMPLDYLHSCYSAFQPTNESLQIVYYRKKDM